MKHIDSALVVGAGAIGSIVAATIHTTSPGSVRVLADSTRMERLRATGIVVNGTRLDIPLAPASQAAADARATGNAAGSMPAPADEQSPEEVFHPGLIIVAVKSYQLDQAIRDMAPYVGKDTVILSLLNGIASEDDLAAAFGRGQVLYSMIIAIDALRENGGTSYSRGGTITFGEARNPTGAWSEPVRAVAEYFDRTGIRYSVPEDMIRSMWFKFMINVGINPASAITGGTYGVFQTVPEARSLMDAAMLELIEISKIMGTGLTEADLPSWYSTLVSLMPGGKTSMLQDVEAGRRTEIDIFAGTVVNLGRATGVPTPVNKTMHDMVKIIEARNGIRI